jgi:hypothetical protein
VRAASGPGAFPRVRFAGQVVGLTASRVPAGCRLAGMGRRPVTAGYAGHDVESPLKRAAPVSYGHARGRIGRRPPPGLLAAGRNRVSRSREHPAEPHNTDPDLAEWRSRVEVAHCLIVAICVDFGGSWASSRGPCLRPRPRHRRRRPRLGRTGSPSRSAGSPPPCRPTDNSRLDRTDAPPSALRWWRRGLSEVVPACPYRPPSAHD